MHKSPLTAAVVAAVIVLAGAAPGYAATASNSQNGTDSSNTNATLSAPKSDAQIPATNMPMGSTTGATPMQDGSGMKGGAMAPNGAAGTGAGMATAPKP